MDGDLLTPEQVAEIRQDNDRIWSEEADTRRPGNIRLLLSDRAEITQELERIEIKLMTHGQLAINKALTALIERIGK